jgi:hypothetical protein
MSNKSSLNLVRTRLEIEGMCANTKNCTAEEAPYTSVRCVKDGRVKGRVSDTLDTPDPQINKRSNKGEAVKAEIRSDDDGHIDIGRCTSSRMTRLEQKSAVHGTTELDRVNSSRRVFGHRIIEEEVRSLGN